MDLVNQLRQGKCLDILKEVPDESFDSCVSDVPYGLGPKPPKPEAILAYLNGAELDTGGDFMGKRWAIPSVNVWKEVYRVLKPGGHVVVFGGSRTFDLISLGLRMAGFVCRDTIGREYPTLQWVYGSGMPKSHNVGKAIDKKLGAKRENDYKSTTVRETPNSSSHRGTHICNNCGKYYGSAEANCKCPKSKPATEEAAEWDGWGTGLKPAWEPILLFRKPFKGSVANNVLKHGTGVLNIDDTRVRHSSEEDFENHKKQVEAVRAKGGVRGNSWKNASDLSGAEEVTEKGRWPSNFVLEHSPECQNKGSKVIRGSNNPGRGSKGGGERGIGYSGSDGKAEGLPFYTDPDNYGMEQVDDWECVPGCPVAELEAQVQESSRFFTQFEGTPYLYEPKANRKEAGAGKFKVGHATLKPLPLMRWLVRLVTPKNGLVLDPYCGSGSTCHAAVLEDMSYFGVELEEEAFAEATKRMELVLEAWEDELYQRRAYAAFLPD